MRHTGQHPHDSARANARGLGKGHEVNGLIVKTHHLSLYARAV